MAQTTCIRGAACIVARDPAAGSHAWLRDADRTAPLSFPFLPE